MTTRFRDTIRTRAGLAIRVKQVGPEDALHLIELFSHLGNESRFLRYNHAVAELSDEVLWHEAIRIAEMDASQGITWLAFADLPGEPGSPVASVRLSLLPPDAAEIAMVVRDDLQGAGIGKQLLAGVAEEARDLGIQKLTALVHKGNARVLRLIRGMPIPLLEVPRGEYIYVEASLAQDVSQPQES